MNADFVIDRVSWHTQRNPEWRERIYLRFWVVVDFLQKNKLTKRQLLSGPADVKEDFNISTADLTEYGLVLMKKPYDKWLKSLSKGKDVRNVAMLEKELAKIRTGE